MLERYDLNDNSNRKDVKIILAFLSSAEKEGYPVPSDYRNFKPKSAPAKADDIALTLEELKALYHFDLSDNSTLEKAKDLFCFMCLTGLRVSDLLQFQKGFIYSETDGKEYIRLPMEKTNETVIIPLLTDAKTIYEKYKDDFGKLPKSYDVILNRKIKEIAKMIPIFDKDETIHETKGSKTTSQICKRYELIKNHTGRRTFATYLAFDLGLPIDTVSRLLGHKSIRTTEIYLKAPKDQIINKAREQLKNYTL